jgi:aldose 1-epimerase
MFSIQHLQEDGFDKLILSNNSSKTQAIILPACGAILHSFIAGEDETQTNIVENYKSYKDFQKDVTKGFIGSKLSPFVCRLNKGTYHFGEMDYQFESFYMDKHTIHGKVFDRNFIIQQEHADENAAFVTMKYEYRKDDKGYPFYYDCEVTWKLENENLLTAITKIVNQDKGLIPVQDGWHPYFTLGGDIDDLQLEFQSESIVEFNDELIPTGRLTPYDDFNSLKQIGERFFDNCFKLNMQTCQPLCVFRNPGKKLQVEIFPGPSYPYLQIYTPPHRRSVAIENLSSAPDGFNNGMGLITLASGDSTTFQTTYKITKLKAGNS